MGWCLGECDRTTILHSDNARRRTGVRAEAGARFEAGNVDSSGAPAEMRWRSEEELGGGEALDNLHGSSAKRTWHGE